MYPVMLSLRGKRCLVVGGGGVALRKVQGLVEDGARVTVIAPEVSEPLGEMARLGTIELERREYRDGEAADHVLVFAATDDRDVNRRVFEDAESAGVWANVADDPELCSFHLPARVRRGGLQLAIASGGDAPFAVRRLRQHLERRMGAEWSEWMEAATRFRNEVLRCGLTPAKREDAFDRFFQGTVDPDRLSIRVPSEKEERAWLGGPPGSGALPHDLPMRGPMADTPGFVSLVGAGPGCPGLLTLRGHQRLMTSDAVVFDRLAVPALPCDLPMEVELHPVGKQAGNHPVPQEEINALLVRLAREGKRVVRLKGGDPYVFGRGSEEAEVLCAEGIPFEVIPGVTSGIAAPAWIGIPVTHRREAVRLTLLTAHEAIKSDGPQVRWDLLARDPHATLVGYMGVTALPQVVERLLEGGMDPATPAAMIEQGTTAAQRSVVSTLAELPAAVERDGLGPPALFVIGPTVGHAERLGWSDRLPLAGERLALPAAAGDLAPSLEGAGAEVVAVPFPVTPAARVVLGIVPLTGCIVRSAAEVDVFHEEREGAGWEGEVHAWCLGGAAATRARERGWRNVREIEETPGGPGLVEAIRSRRTDRPAGNC